MNRNRGSKNKMRMLSPIRETSGIIPVHVIPKGTKVMKGAAGHAPILVQALPEEAKNPKPEMKPIDRNYTAVEQVVADYLHYSKYGQVMPVLYGGGSEFGNPGTSGDLRCTCCIDRNRENVHKKMALARGEDIHNLQHDDTINKPARDVPEPPEVKIENSSSTRLPRHHQSQMNPPHARNRWGYYQPSPHAGTFLNPEFNRPFTLQTVQEDDGRRERDQHSYIYTKILEADHKFDQSMKKLETHVQSRFEIQPNEVYVPK